MIPTNEWMNEHDDWMNQSINQGDSGHIQAKKVGYTGETIEDDGTTLNTHA